MAGFAAIYVDADTFTLTGDQTEKFVVGRRVQAYCGSVDGYKYGTIQSVSYAPPNTTVNLYSTNDDLTPNLSYVWYGEQSPGNSGTVPLHVHDASEGSGGIVDATAHKHSILVAGDGSPDPAVNVDDSGNIRFYGGQINIASATSGLLSMISLGGNGSGDRYAYINFVGDDTYTTYGLRIIRYNTGANANTSLLHHGTGDFNFYTQEAASLVFGTTNAARVTIAANGNITQENGLYFATDEIRARDSGGLLLRDDSGTLGITIADGGNVSLVNGTSINEFSIDGVLAGNSDDAVPTEKAVKTYVDSSRYYYHVVDYTETDQGVAGNGKTIKAYVDAIGSDSGTIWLRHNSGSATTTYTLTTSEVIPANIKLVIEPGAILDGAGTITISSMNRGFHQRFGASITVLFNAGDGTSEISPEWWGEFPNGYSDHGALNKAIAAANSVGSASGYDDPFIVVRPGRYYIAHDTLSTIKTSFVAPHAYFSAINNTTADGSLFVFDFSEWYDAHRNIEIGTILGKDTMAVGGTHYNIGIQILAGNACELKVGSILGLHTALLADAGVENKHIGSWNIDIRAIGGCERGVHYQCGDTGGTSAGVEGMNTKIGYIFYTDLGISVETDSGVVANPTHITGCEFEINAFEIHNPANLNGIRVSGEGSYNNTFKVPGTFIPCATCDMLTIANDARDNLFEFCHMDWDYITNASGGYNVFRETSNPTMIVPSLSIVSNARSEIMRDAAPTTLPWREGDKVWNENTSDGILGWVCIADGTPGTWTEINLGEPRENALINQDFSIWQENTTFTSPVHGSYVADGYFVEIAAGGGVSPTTNVKKNVANVETGFAQCCEIEITNVGATGATRFWRQSQKIEDFEKYRGKAVAFSFRIKASTAMTLPGGKLWFYDGVALVETAVTSLTTSWVTYTGIITIDNAATTLWLFFNMIDGAGAISTTGSIYIQWMKLELGSVTTPLIPRSGADELRMCQRYYQKSYAQGTFAGTATNTGSLLEYMSALANADYTTYKTVKFPVVMKAAPTVTIYDLAGNGGSGAAARVTMSAGNNLVGTVIDTTGSGFNVHGTNGAAATTRHLQFHYTAVARL